MSEQMQYGPNGYEPVKPSDAECQDEKVGYKSPPRASQWKKGQSGNPTGRKKRPVVTDLRELLDSILDEPTKIREGGHLRTVPVLEAIVLAYGNAAVTAHDRRLVLQAFKLAERLGMMTPHDPRKGVPYILHFPYKGPQGRILRMYRKEQAALQEKTRLAEETKMPPVGEDEETDR